MSVATQSSSQTLASQIEHSLELLRVIVDCSSRLSLAIQEMVNFTITKQKDEYKSEIPALALVPYSLARKDIAEIVDSLDSIHDLENVLAGLIANSTDKGFLDSPHPATAIANHLKVKRSRASELHKAWASSFSPIQRPEITPSMIAEASDMAFHEVSQIQNQELLQDLQSRLLPKALPETPDTNNPSQSHTPSHLPQVYQLTENQQRKLEIVRNREHDRRRRQHQESRSALDKAVNEKMISSAMKETILCESAQLRGDAPVGRMDVIAETLAWIAAQREDYHATCRRKNTRPQSFKNFITADEISKFVKAGIKEINAHTQPTLRAQARSGRYFSIKNEPDEDSLVSIHGKLTPEQAANLRAIMEVHAKPAARQGETRDTRTRGQRHADSLDEIATEASRAYRKANKTPDNDPRAMINVAVERTEITAINNALRVIRAAQQQLTHLARQTPTSPTTSTTPSPSTGATESPTASATASPSTGATESSLSYKPQPRVSVHNVVTNPEAESTGSKQTRSTVRDGQETESPSSTELTEAMEAMEASHAIASSKNMEVPHATPKAECTDPPSIMATGEKDQARSTMATSEKDQALSIIETAESMGAPAEQIKRSHLDPLAHPVGSIHPEMQTVLSQAAAQIAEDEHTNRRHRNRKPTQKPESVPNRNPDEPRNPHPQSEESAVDVSTRRHFDIASSEGKNAYETAIRFLLTHTYATNTGYDLTLGEIHNLGISDHYLISEIDEENGRIISLTSRTRSGGPLFRDLKLIEQGVCAMPGSTMGVAMCDLHHIQAWDQGGETDMDNLAAISKSFHVANDDSKQTPHKGHIERHPITGEAGWVKPRHVDPAQHVFVNRQPAAQRAPLRRIQAQRKLENANAKRLEKEKARLNM